MQKKRSLLLLILCLAVVFLGAFLLYNITTGNPQDTITPETLEAFDGLDILSFSAEDQSGNPVQLSDFLGRPTIVYFWTSWCGWCTRGMEELDFLYRQEGDNIQVIAVNLPHLGRSRGELAAGRAFMEESWFTFPSIYDVDGEAQYIYSVTAVPRTLFINSDGTLLHDQLGFLNMTGLWDIAQHLS
ncbi:MAG: TlpA family protein disulfide reductase [Oscillospiraceae bacterium]|nr:TlpA family protein disulfide reductase [Oscillospiraceae bacterium]